jgi:hypothetical protein
MSVELHHGELEVVLRDQNDNIGYGHAQPTMEDVLAWLGEEPDVIGMYWCEIHANLIECEPGCTEEMKPVLIVPFNTGGEEEE